MLSDIWYSFHNNLFFSLKKKIYIYIYIFFFLLSSHFFMCLFHFQFRLFILVKITLYILNYTLDYTLHPKIFEHTFCILKYHTLHLDITFVVIFNGMLLHMISTYIFYLSGTNLKDWNTFSIYYYYFLVFLENFS